MSDTSRLKNSNLAVFASGREGQAMSNPLKRQHTDGGGKGPRFEGEQDPGACTPDGDVWFSDGNIDIVAEGTSFRVHRGILSVHSELFRNMLSMPQPGGPDSVSCPVIEVSDSSSDMRHLLLAIYNCHPSFAPHLTAKFELVLRLVRLAHKYQVKRIMDDAMSRLKTLYPDDFGVFLEMLNKPPNSTLSGHQDMDCLDVIQLAKLVGSQSLLHDSDRLQHSCPSRRELSRSFDSPTNESTALVNDQEAWFWDGNIDIVAGNIRFHVHRSVLSAHSELFHDMLSIPQPENGGAQEQDRFPVVEVTDSADDMRHLLLTLYNRNKYFEAHVQPKFGVVCSIARLAHKYQVRGVLDDAMRRVKSIYVDNVPDLLDAINGTASTTSSCPGYRDSLRVLELSRLLGDTSPLRSAYYYLAQTLPHDLQLN